MLIMWRCGCVYCTMGGDPSGVAVLHHGVTQPVLHPSVGTRLVMHGEADICCPIQTGDGLPLTESRAGDEVGSSGHVVRFVVHAVMMAQNRGQWGDWWTLCQLVGQPTSLYHLVGKFLQTASHRTRTKSSNCSCELGKCSHKNSSQMPSMSSISCSRAVSISSWFMLLKDVKVVATTDMTVVEV